ncbi:MAG: Arginine-tRNA ligase, partial [uncultured bacterium]
MVVATKNLISQMSGLLENENGSAITQIGKGKKIAVEYTDPNPFKEFHLGHLYSNAIGESLSRLFEACGAVVWRGDFYGDVGMHIAKSIYGLLAELRIKNSELRMKQGKDYIRELKKYIGELGKLPVSQRQKLLGEGYALGVVKYEEDKAVAEEIKDLNYLIYVAAQEILKKDKGWQPMINYQKLL